MCRITYFAAMLVIVIEMAQTDPPKLPTTISPSSMEYDQSMFATTCPEKAKAYLNEKLDWFCPCGCGMSAWTRMAMCHCYKHDYPEGTTCDFRTIRRKRATSRSSKSASLTLYSVRYSTKCGRILRYGDGAAAFLRHTSSIESEYILGVSLTHGPPGNRSRIWSSVAAYFEHSSYTKSNCPCTNIEVQ